ncbi:YihY/virulence factor BrkB family protein [bacterium]|nr:YihY/virulence factor BrkB family protein [bacterium]
MAVIRFRLNIIKFWKVLVISFRHFLRDQCFNKAAALSYFAFLTSIPILLLLISLVGKILRSNEQALEYFLNIIQVVTPTGFDFISQILQKTMSSVNVSTWVGFSTLVWIMLGFFGALENNFNTIWKTRKRRNFLKSKLLGLFLMALLIIFIALNFFLNNLLQIWIHSESLREYFPLPFNLQEFGNNLLYYSYLVVAGTTFFLFNKIVPAVYVKSKAALLGSGMTLFMTEVARIGYQYYINLPKNNLLYGSLLTASVLIIWIYYTMITILFGCELTKTLHQSLP